MTGQESQIVGIINFVNWIN